MHENIWNVMRGGGDPSFAPPPPQNLKGKTQAFTNWIRGVKGRTSKHEVISLIKLGSAAVSANMRAGERPSEVDALLELFRRAPRSTGPVVLYRGMSAHFLDQVDKSFITCSSAIDVAYRYSWRRKGGEAFTVVALLVPPGTPMVSKRGISRDSEYLLLPGHLKTAGEPFQMRVPNFEQQELRQLFEAVDHNDRMNILADLRDPFRDSGLHFEAFRANMIKVVPAYYTPNPSFLQAATVSHNS